MAYLHVYKDGVQISEGTGLAPLVVGPLNASESETSAAQEVVIKTDAGYTTYGNTTVSFEGSNAAKWSVSATTDGAYSRRLYLFRHQLRTRENPFISKQPRPVMKPPQMTNQ